MLRAGYNIPTVSMVSVIFGCSGVSRCKTLIPRGFVSLGPFVEAEELETERRRLQEQTRVLM